jgi:hypothetical protein
VLLPAALAAACQEPELVVGAWSCPVHPRAPDDAGVLEAVRDPVALPWSTDFEHDLCDLYVAQGYCYEHENSSYEIVDTVARSGKKSLAFTIDTTSADGEHTRCVREGTLPEDAIYGAWYYIPEQRTDIDNWNILHFQGAEPGADIHNLWDISVQTDDATGRLKLFGRGYVPFRPLLQDDPPTFIPIGAWFHVEFRLRRAADATGRATIYQDGKVLVDREDIATDDTTWGQWYVGNLANSLTPADSTVYVDDISIRPAP